MECQQGLVHVAHLELIDENHSLIGSVTEASRGHDGLLDLLLSLVVTAMTFDDVVSSQGFGRNPTKENIIGVSIYFCRGLLV